MENKTSNIEAIRRDLIEIAKCYCRYEKCYGKQNTDCCENCYFGGQLADHLIKNGVVLKKNEFL
jgi:hypothetical protein